MGRIVIAVAIMCLLTVSASPVLADPATHTSFDPAGDTILCSTKTYTITSGTFYVVDHVVTNAAGGSSASATLTPRDVTATDEAGNLYSLRGILRFGGTSSANAGTFHFEGELQIISHGGGTVDSVNIVLAISPAGETFFYFGTCDPPQDNP
jgi:hypothetical protein